MYDINLSINNSSLIAPAARELNIMVVYQDICRQLNSYFINTGIFIIVFSITMQWLLWWYMNYGYKKIEIGNLGFLDNRIYWDNFIRHKLNMLALGYIAVVVWLNRGF
jgi:hypothetical protein